MKSGLLHHFTAWCAVGAFICQSSFADIFHLKDGRVLEATILEEREDSYLLEVQVTRSIKDEVTVAKDDVLSIEREEPDASAFANIRDLTPTPDLLTQNEYTGRIETIREFIENFPDSEHIAEARDSLDTHLTELETIEAGGIKFDGELICRDERLENAYYIDSRIAETSIRRLIQESALRQALRQFNEFEQDFTGSEAWHALLPLMQQVATSHQTSARGMLDDYDDLIAMQEVGLGRMGHEERHNTMRAINERDHSLRNRHQREREDQETWLSLHPYYKPALEETVRVAEREIRRLEAAASQSLQDPTPSQLWRDAIAAIQSGDESAANAAIAAARSGRMSATYISRLEKLAGKDD